MNLTDQEKQVLTALQRGIEPVTRPFADLPLPETEVLSLLRHARESGLLRRFGGVFDARRLGYRSVLCAVSPEPEQIRATAAVVAANPGVTHCYERRPLSVADRYPSLWFTLALLHDQFEDGLDQVRLQLKPYKLLLLPALRRFKIDVVFDLRTRERDETFPGLRQAAAASGADDLPLPENFKPLTEAEREIVRRLDGDLPLSACPFAAVAGQLGITETALLLKLQDWRQQGLLRRIGAILHHRKAGFKANGMCVWPVDTDVLSAGRLVAARAEVTHCYQRPRLPEFPFDLYAMIHTGNADATRALYQEITSACGLPRGELFISLNEFKKNSMRYFAE